MHKLFFNLKTKATVAMKKILKISVNVLAGFAANLIYLILLLIFLTQVIEMNIMDVTKYMHDFYTGGNGFWEDTIGKRVFFSIIFAPIWEEALFRLLPLALIRETKEWIIPKECGNGEGLYLKRLLLPVVFANSIIFGWAHGHVLNILIQGVSGLCMNWVYIRSNGGYWAAVVLHALWNTMIIFGLPSLIPSLTF